MKRMHLWRRAALLYVIAPNAITSQPIGCGGWVTSCGWGRSATLTRPSFLLCTMPAQHHGEHRL
jgi:hypothetical protein